MEWRILLNRIYIIINPKNLHRVMSGHQFWDGTLIAASATRTLLIHEGWLTRMLRVCHSADWWWVVSGCQVFLLGWEQGVPSGMDTGPEYPSYSGSGLMGIRGPTDPWQLHEITGKGWLSSELAGMVKKEWPDTWLGLVQ